MRGQAFLPIVASLMLLADPASGEEDPLDGLTGDVLKSYREGQALLNRGDDAAAAEAFTSVLQANPHCPEAYDQRAKAYRALEDRAATTEERDRFALRRIRDESQAATIRAHKEIASDVSRQSRILIPALLIHFSGWIVGIVLMKKGYPVVSLRLLLFCSPVGVLLMLLHGPEDNQPAERPFEDHPLEVALRAANVANAESDHEDASTQPCPNCGRINSTSSRICPRCETRLA